MLTLNITVSDGNQRILIFSLKCSLSTPGGDAVSHMICTMVKYYQLINKPLHSTNPVYYKCSRTPVHQYISTSVHQYILLQCQLLQLHLKNSLYLKINYTQPEFQSMSLMKSLCICYKINSI